MDGPTLIGNTSFYPRTEMSAEERLVFYADHFPIVEVDSTYYAPLGALHSQVETSRQKEVGCLRFEVFQDVENPNRILIYEVFATKEDYVEVHQHTPHYTLWRSTVDEAEVRERVVQQLVPVRVEL